MKGSIAASAALAAAVAAQNVSISYSTITIDDCPSSIYQSLVTVTDGVTITYCPECEHGGPPPTQTPQTTSASTTGPGFTTIYTTTYMSYCPSSSTIVPVTYTVTETCAHSTPTWTPGPSHIPQGYTTTVVTCHQCAETPTEVTITQPCDCEATEGTPVPTPNPQPSPSATYPAGSNPPGPPSQPTGPAVSQISDGQIQAPPPGTWKSVATPASQSPGGQAPPPPAGPSGQAPPPPAGPSGQAPPPPPAGPSGQAPPPPAGPSGQSPPPPPAGPSGQAPPPAGSSGQAPPPPAGSGAPPASNPPNTPAGTNAGPTGSGSPAPTQPVFSGASGLASGFSMVSYSIIAVFVGMMAVGL